MTPTYTPDDIELWRELRVAFDLNTSDYKAFCYLSQAFGKLFDNPPQADEVKRLARCFLAHHPKIQCEVGIIYLFRSKGTSADVARSLFIDWNIERLTTTK